MSRPLAVRWHAHALPEFRAGALATARIEFENAGTSPWRPGSLAVSYHWLDELRNPIVWDGLRTAVTAEPGDMKNADVVIRAPIPPGRYRLAFDVVDEGRFWLSELGNDPLELPTEVHPRIQSLDEAAAHFGDAVPAPDWSRRVLAAHREGYAVVGGSVDAVDTVLRRRPRSLAPYVPGRGRIPNFGHPLVCPSIVHGVDVEWTEVAGLPAALPPADEPSLYDGRIRVRLPSGRRRR